jgi:hypothetical protein
VVLGLAAVLWPLSSASAQPASGGGVVLESYSLSAGGGALQNPNGAEGAGLPSRADVSVGPSLAIGVMQGGGITLEAGFWPTVVTVPEPSASLLTLVSLASLALLARRSSPARLLAARGH